ncbi:hypothetical protein FBU30_004967 [Linnemannia zychae]|nr:hypothetical protein FBU30_004967 [Linnemannia zychae]
MSEQERNCYCSAARSETWLQKCNNPVEACNNMTINEAKSTYNAVKFFCDAAGIRPPTPGQSGTPPDKGTTPGQGNNSPDQDIPSLAMSLSMGMSTFVGLITAAAVASLGALENCEIDETLVNSSRFLNHPPSEIFTM